MPDNLKPTPQSRRPRTSRSRIGGMLDNDFVALASSLGVGLDAIATVFLLTSLISPVIAFLLYRYERYWQQALKGF